MSTESCGRWCFVANSKFRLMGEKRKCGRRLRLFEPWLGLLLLPPTTLGCIITDETGNDWNVEAISGLAATTGPMAGGGSWTYNFVRAALRHASTTCINCPQLVV